MNRSVFVAQPDLPEEVPNRDHRRRRLQVATDLAFEICNGSKTEFYRCTIEALTVEVLIRIDRDEARLFLEPHRVTQIGVMLPIARSSSRPAIVFAAARGSDRLRFTLDNHAAHILETCMRAMKQHFAGASVAKQMRIHTITDSLSVLVQREDIDLTRLTEIQRVA
jgi:hypothetical protein